MRKSGLFRPSFNVVTLLIRPVRLLLNLVEKRLKIGIILIVKWLKLKENDKE